MNPWLQFTLCATLILIAGPILIREVRTLATRFGWSNGWAGGILVATATSLPELLSGVSAVTLADAPDIAIGDALGSCVVNLALLALLDVLCREDSIFSFADQGHVLSAAMGTLLIGLVGTGLLAAASGFDPILGHVSLYTPLIVVTYLIVVRAMTRHERGRIPALDDPAPAITRRAIMAVAGAALVLAGAGTWLPIAAAAIARDTGLAEGFVGTSIVAAATSVPELVVMIAALRMRSVDLAIAGLLGSNIFNIAIIAIDDIAYQRGSLFSAVSPAHAGTAFGAVIMSSIVIAAIIDRPRVRVFGRVGWISVFLVAAYAMTGFAIYART